MRARMTKTFFFDTYALIEVYKENKNYEKYKEDVKIMLNRLNLLEFAFFLIREKKEEDVKNIFEKLSKFNIDYDNEVLVESAKMKSEFQKERLSFVDCIGYNLAKRNNIKFLTGDEKFKNRENVEFVK